MTLIAAAAFLGVLGTFGVVALRRLAPLLSRLELVAYGAPMGTVLGTLVILVLARLVGLTAATLVATGAAFAATLLLAPSAFNWERVRSARLPREWTPAIWIPAVVIGLIGLRMVIFWAGALVYEEGNLVAGHVNIWGDWPVHLGIANSFAFGENFPPVHPRFSGHPLAYHYLSDLTPAGMISLGLDSASALTLHSLVFSLLTALAIFAFARRLTGDAVVGSVVLALFLVGGSLGWIVMAQQGLAGDVTGGRLWDGGAVGAANIRWQNMFYGFLMSQRAFLYGMPMAFLALTLVLLSRRSGSVLGFIAAGAILGLLPLAHLATMLALALVVPFLIVLLPHRGWMYLMAAWILVALPQLILQQGGGPGALAAMRIQLGWVAGDDLWPIFWLKQVGLFAPLLLIALVRPKLIPDESRRMLTAFMAIFVVANVVVFQPWDWDNHKVLVYWYLATCVFVGALLVWAWREHGKAARAWVAIGVTTMLLSGLLEDANQALGRDRYGLLNAEELAVAYEVRQSTPPDAVFAAGIQNNHPVPTMAGRRVIMGYPGWLWTEGLPYGPRESDLRALYAFTDEAGAIIARYGLDYLVLGPNEREALAANVDALRAAFPTVISTENYDILDLDGE